MLNCIRGDIVLNISYEFRKGILFIRLVGELNKNTSLKLKEEITDMIEDNGITNVVFNVANLISIDIFGINNLLNNFQICRKNKGNALLCGVNNKFKLVFQKYQEFKEYMIDDELNAFRIIEI